VNSNWPDPAYRTLTPALLASVSADDVGDVVAQHVELRVVDSGGDRDSVVAHLPAGVQAVYTTWLVDVEVNNGGFNQFFFNPYGALAGLALAGYELMRADDYASVMRAAIATYEAERESMAAFYESDSPEALEESYEHTALGDVDQQYYSLGDRIYDIWAVFAHDRPELFMK
jgi:hypothetical protein